MKTKQIFIQDTGIYSNEIIVAVNSSKDDILKFVKKLKGAKKEAVEWIKTEERAFEIFEKNNALVAHNDGRFMLLLRRPTDEWTYWECLLHELHHIVHYIAQDKMFENEMEAQAYLQEYLFHSIRRKIMGGSASK